MVICLERGADLHMAQLMPLPLTVSCFSKIQIVFTFLVPAHLGSPGKRAIKRVCVCVCMYSAFSFTYLLTLHCPHRARSGVYVTVRCQSVCMSQHGPTAANPLLMWARRAAHIDRLLHGAQQRGVRRASAGSAALLAYVGSWGPIYKISYDNLTIILR